MSEDFGSGNPPGSVRTDGGETGGRSTDGREQVVWSWVGGLVVGAVLGALPFALALVVIAP